MLNDVCDVGGALARPAMASAKKISEKEKVFIYSFLQEFAAIRPISLTPGFSRVGKTAR
jgi:hypothetical protein